MNFKNICGFPRLSSQEICYVYTFASSLDGMVFYVGKGTGNRIRSHLAEASGKRAEISRVALRIREIWQQGGKVIIRKPYASLSDLDAFEMEAQLIKHYGYSQLINQDWHACHRNQWCPPRGKRNGW